MFHLLLESVLPEFDHYLEIYTFSTSMVISTSKPLRPGATRSVEYISIYLTSLALCTFSN
jgi:hypothetical protein